MSLSEWECVNVCVCVSTINGKTSTQLPFIGNPKPLLRGLLSLRPHLYGIHTPFIHWTRSIGVCVCVWALWGLSKEFPLQKKKQTQNTKHHIKLYSSVKDECMCECTCVCGPLDKPSQLLSGIITDNFTAISTMPIKILFVLHRYMCTSVCVRGREGECLCIRICWQWPHAFVLTQKTH